MSVHGVRRVAAAGVLVLLAAACAPDPLDAPGQGTVSAFPRPGTGTASPHQEFAFRGIDASDAESIQLHGSETGDHGYSVIAHSDGGGASLRLTEPFTAGETVSVDTSLDIAHTDDGDYEITIARPPPPPPPPENGDGEDPDDGPGTDAPEYTPRAFVTRPDLHAPDVEITANSRSGDDGLLFYSIGVQDGWGSGVYITESDGDLVWARTAPPPPENEHDATWLFNLHLAELGGEQVLVWWEGRFGAGYGPGEWIVADEHYEEITRVQAVGYESDPHEILFAERDGMETAVLVAYHEVEGDLTDVGGPTAGMLVESIVQEIDLATGAVVFEWHSTTDVPMDDYRLGPTDHFADHPHVNAIAVDRSGDFLVSNRNSSDVYRLDRHTGDVVWRLGGDSSDFTFSSADGVSGIDPARPFAFQHDARRLDDGRLSLFDNGTETSRVLFFELDEDDLTATVQRVVRHDPDVFGQFTGNVQQLSDDAMFVSWGSSGAFTRYDAAGGVAFDGTYRGTRTYRTYLLDWTGHPTEEPRIELARQAGSWVATVSWNGATEVAQWLALSGNEPVAQQDRDGFETEIDLGSNCRDDLRVRAVDADDETLTEVDAGTLPGC